MSYGNAEITYCSVEKAQLEYILEDYNYREQYQCTDNFNGNMYAGNSFSIFTYTDT